MIGTTTYGGGLGSDAGGQAEVLRLSQCQGTLRLEAREAVEGGGLQTQQAAYWQCISSSGVEVFASPCGPREHLTEPKCS